MRRTTVKNRIGMRTRARAIAVSAGIVLALTSATACGTNDQPDDSAEESQSAGAAGETAPAGDESASAPEEISMPSVIDKNAAVAEDELEKLGFTEIELGSVDSEHDTLGVVNPANWTVKEQSHKKGDKVAADSTIVLGCVKNS